MIKKLSLKFGRAAEMANECVPALPITVFVGPNNSGKSKILTEIQQFCSNGVRNINAVIIDSVELEGVRQDEVDQRIAGVTLRPGPNEAIQSGHIFVGKRGAKLQVNKEQLARVLADPQGQPQQACQWFLAYNTLILNGQNRINLVNQQSAGNLQEPAHTSFQVLFRDDEKRKEVRRIIHDAFGQYLVVDPTNLGHLNLRLSQTEPESDLQERGIHSDAVQFHAQAVPIGQASDGVKAFTGMITEMIAGDPSVLLMDEPEAFLHPSLSFKLGKEVAGVMSGSEKRLFVSTHSPNFVMGCIQSGAPVNIVRLTYRDGVPTARILPNSEILRLMRNPLLRSTGVLSGLFYEFVVVTESDADRAFYQEINDRMLRENHESGIPNCLFLNAQNKQTVKTIIKPLRELGIPVAGIVDIDVLKDGGAVWTSFLDSGFIPDIEKASLAGLRGDLNRKLGATGRNMKRDGGKEILAGSDKEALENLFEKLQEYGLFVVPCGELESWLPALGATGHGPSWLIDIFERMGEDPAGIGYLHPGGGDVWQFLSGVRQWFMNPRRKGVPQ